MRYGPPKFREWAKNAHNEVRDFYAENLFTGLALGAEFEFGNVEASTCTICGLRPTKILGVAKIRGK